MLVPIDWQAAYLASHVHSERVARDRSGSEAAQRARGQRLAARALQQDESVNATEATAAADDVDEFETPVLSNRRPGESVVIGRDRRRRRRDRRRNRRRTDRRAARAADRQRASARAIDPTDATDPPERGRLIDIEV